MAARSNDILRLAIGALLVTRAPRPVQRVIAFMALGALLAVAVIVLSVSARGDGSASRACSIGGTGLGRSSNDWPPVRYANPRYQPEANGPEIAITDAAKRGATGPRASDTRRWVRTRRAS